MTNMISDYGKTNHNSQPRQLDLFPLQIKPYKRQISSTPGTSPKVRNRYRVTLGDKILGDRLTLDEALKIAKRGEI